MWVDRRTFLRRVGAGLVVAGIAGATRGALARTGATR